MQTPHRCVLVDDDPDTLALLRRFIEMTCPDFDVITFPDGVEALEFFASNAADLIITDFKMPLMDGLQLITAVRHMDREVPIVMVSSMPVEAQALALGANAFVQKTSIAAQLAPVIQRLTAPFYGRPLPNNAGRTR